MAHGYEVPTALFGKEQVYKSTEKYTYIHLQWQQTLDYTLMYLVCTYTPYVSMTSGNASLNDERHAKVS